MNLNTFLQIMNIDNKDNISDILNSLIIYLRKSRKDNDYFKNESIEKTLERHEKDIQEFILNTFGEKIKEENIYREVASGDTIEDRPVMQEVLHLIENDDIKGVVCIEIERLARGNTIDQGIIAQAFKYTKTKIITVMPPKIYNLDDENDLSYFEDGLFQSRKYLNYTKRILSRGRIRSVKEGNFVGSIAPYGYDKFKNVGEKGFTLVYNEYEKKVVELIADLLLNGLNTTYIINDGDTISSIASKFGVTKDIIQKENLNNDFKIGLKIKVIIKDMGTTKVARYFNILGIKSRSGKQWTSNMIRNIILNDAIYGLVTWEKRKTVKCLNNGLITKSRPIAQDYLCIKAKHPAILQLDVKHKITEKLAKNKQISTPNQKEIKNSLSGLIKCGYCNSKMVRRPYSYYKILGKQNIDKEQLRIFLMDAKKKSGYSLNQIAKMIQVPKTTVDHWFVTNKNKLSIPSALNWDKLLKIFNIKSTIFDDKIKNVKKIKHVDTLICNTYGCKCVASDLNLVEERVLSALSQYLEEYKKYVNNYEETIKEEINNNNNTIEILNQEIKKINTQIEKVCELVENGTYTKELFVKRKTKLDSDLKKITAKKNELAKTDNINKTFSSKKNAIPILEKILSDYSNNLTAKEKNELLSLIIKEIIYYKDKGGRNLKDNFTLKIILRF